MWINLKYVDNSQQKENQLLDINNPNTYGFCFKVLSKQCKEDEVDGYLTYLTKLKTFDNDISIGLGLLFETFLYNLIMGHISLKNQ